MSDAKTIMRHRDVLVIREAELSRLLHTSSIQVGKECSSGLTEAS